MTNILTIHRDLNIATYTGQTGSGETVENESAENITGESFDDLISNAALVWGVDLDDAVIEIK